MEHSVLKDALVLGEWLKPKIEIWLMQEDAGFLTKLETTLLQAELLLAKKANGDTKTAEDVLTLLKSSGITHPTWKILVSRLEAIHRAQSPQDEKKTQSVVLSTVLGSCLEVLNHFKKGRVA